MTRAVALAARGAGTASPGALVGAVIVGPAGDVWGEGWYGRYGGSHAEVWAVRDAEARGFGGRLREATLVVTLEPCSHWGKTPPCADLVVRTGSRASSWRTPTRSRPSPGRASRASAPPASRSTSGRRAGRPRRQRRLPDARRDGPAARDAQGRGDAGRAGRDAHRGQPVDNRARGARARPCLARRGRRRARRRRDGARRRPRADGPRRAACAGRTRPAPHRPRPHRRAPAHARPVHRWTADARRRRPWRHAGLREAVRDAGGAVWTVPEADGHLDLGALLDALGAGRDAAGTPLPQDRTLVQSVLVEAGPGLATALLRARLADRIRWFVAPKLVGAGRQRRPPRRRRDGRRARLRPARVGDCRPGRPALGVARVR